MLANDQKPKAVLEDILYKRIYETVDDQALVKPDGTLLTNIVEGVADRRDDLSSMIMSNYKAKKEGAEGEKRKEQPEGLLFSVLLCASYELLAHQDIDAPIIISDYIDVGHAFFDRGETRLINGVLDKIAKGIQ